MATAQPFFGHSRPTTNLSANVFPAEPPPSAIAQSVASNLAHHPELHSIRRCPLLHRRHGRRSDDCDTVHRGTRIIGAARRWTLFRLSSVGLVASAGHAITVGPIMPCTRVVAGHGARLFAAIGGVAVHLFSHPLGSVVVIRDRRWRAANWDDERQHQNRGDGAHGHGAIRPCSWGRGYLNLSGPGGPRSDKNVFSQPPPAVPSPPRPAGWPSGTS
jgi:hypothetical protein